MPSPETLKHKILLNIVHSNIGNAKSASFMDKTSGERMNTGTPSVIEERWSSNKAFRRSPLTVVVTDPDGEEKLARQDTGSMESTSESDFFKSRSFNPRIGQGRLLPTMQTHPRLARLAALLCPEPTPSSSRLLFEHYHAATRATSSADEDRQKWETRWNFGRTQQESIGRTPMLHESDTSSAQLSGMAKDNCFFDKPSELEVVALLSSLAYARNVRMGHMARKKRLLRRLMRVAYGNKTKNQPLYRGSQRNTLPTDAAKGQPLSPQPEKSSDSHENRGIRKWFSRQRKFPSKLENIASTRRPSGITVIFPSVRRLSECPSLKQEKSSLPSTPGTDLGSSVSKKFANFCRRVSVRSGHGRVSTSNSSNDKTNEVQTKSFLADQVEYKAVMPNEMMSKSDSLSSPVNLSDQSLRQSFHPERTGVANTPSGSLVSYELQPRSQSHTGVAMKLSCGNCSCSSGSRSSRGSSSDSLSGSSIGSETGATANVRNLSHQPPKSAYNYPMGTMQLVQGSAFSRGSPAVFSAGANARNTLSSSKKVASASPTSVSSSSQSNDEDDTSFTSGCSSSDFNTYRFSDRHSRSIPITNNAHTVGHTDTKIVTKNLHKRSGLVAQKVDCVSSNESGGSSKHVHSESPWSTSDSEHSDAQMKDSSKVSSVVESDLWAQSIQWLAKCRVAVATSAQIQQILRCSITTRTLSEYAKHRLVLVSTVLNKCTWKMQQLLHSVGCQLVPVGVVPSLGKGKDTSSPHHELPSVRRQVKNAYFWEAMQQQQPTCDGYLLKPARLRMKTINRTHRYPDEWMTAHPFHSNANKHGSHDEVAPRSLLQTPSKWPYTPCVCCYDPLSDETSFHYLRQLYNQGGPKTSYWPSSVTYDQLLPRNLTLQILNCMGSAYLVGSYEKMDGPTSPKMSTSYSHKLPRRYHRAASSVAHTNTDVKSQPSKEYRLCSSGEDDYDNYPFVDYSKKGRNGTRGKKSQEHCDRENRIQFLAEKICPLEETQQQGHVTKLMNWISQETRDSDVCPKLSHSQTVHNVTSLTSYDPQCHSSGDLFGSCHSLCTGTYGYRIHFDGWRTEFTRMTIPEQTIIRLRAVLFSEGKNFKPLASGFLTLNSPLDHSLMGYHHLNLLLEEEPNQKTAPTAELPKPTSSHHYRHSQLRNTLGLPIFCKVNLDVYTPCSLGTLVDAVSCEFSSRGGSLSRKSAGSHSYPETQEATNDVKRTDR
ncbi:unnamed protein product [Dicrocoelium dendriticum]|nr:unnamed protein product [Dicrocoelium dendriticum]